MGKLTEEQKRNAREFFQANELAPPYDRELEELATILAPESHVAHTAALVQALKLARPVLDEELQSLCTSYCPPCAVGEVYDYSELKEPELGWITETEAALDAVDAALDGQP